MEEMEKTVTENLEIDKFNLDDELTNQPSLYFHYASLLVEANDDVIRLKEAIDIAEAQADSRIREIATVKITEAFVKGRVAQDEDVLQAHDRYFNAVKNKNLLEAAVKAFEQRRSSLDNLVRLHTTSYYAEPTETVYAKAAEQELKSENVKQIVRTRINGKV